MRLEQATVVLRPRTAAEVLDLALRWGASVAAPVWLRLAPWVLLPPLALVVWLRFGAGWSPQATWITAAALASAVQAPFVVAAARLLFERSVRVRAVLAATVARAPAFVPAFTASGLLMALGTVTVLFAPRSWAVGAFVHETSLLEGNGARRALVRSHRLAQRRLVGTLQMMLALLGVRVAAVVLADALGGAVLDHALQVGRPFGDLWEDGVSLSALVGLFSAVPFVAAARMLAYLDLRTRLDGWDLQLRFMALARAAR